MSSFHTYPSIYNLGHRAIADLLKGSCGIEEKIDGCVTAGTKILAADLRYIEAGNLKIGDIIVGCDNTVTNPRLRYATVSANKPIKKPVIFLAFDDGRELYASNDHAWLVRGKANNSKYWCESKDLSIGDRMVALPRFEYEQSYKSGYLAAGFDGEGSLVKSGNMRVLSFYQSQNEMLAHIKRFLIERGYVFAEDKRKRAKKLVSSIIVRGGWSEIIRFIGSVRPPRIIGQAPKIWENAPTNGLLSPKLIHKEKSGTRSVIGLSTSTHTYNAEGMLCHNSQFSFGAFKTVAEDNSDVIAPVELKVRSKGAVIHPDAPEKMFTKAVETVKGIQNTLHVGWTYRGEYLAKPRHNVLAYDRVPKGYIIIFDINTDEETYLSYEEKQAEASRIGLECVPRLCEPKIIENIEEFRGFLERISILGGQKIEGVVVKPLNYDLFGRDKKVLMGKYVSEQYKEIHAKAWKTDNPTNRDVLEILGATYGTQTRWAKAVQHLRDAGKLEDDPRDIGLLMREIPADVEKECEDEIKQKLYDWAMPHVRRMLTRGVPSWYKDVLLRGAFDVAERAERP